jgi:hypothetical protein
MRYLNLEKHIFLDITSTSTHTFVTSRYQCTETHSIEVFDCRLNHFFTFISIRSSSAKHLPPRGFFSGPNRWRSLRGQVQTKVNVPEVPTVVLEFPPGFFMLYVFWHCHDAAVFLWTASQSFNRTSQYYAEFTFSSHFWKWANNTPRESQSMVSITLNFSVEQKCEL